jgi:4-diphosphocytidyl-2-C-methyl-D-erythritol kinase
MQQDRLALEAPAKINLYLKVTGRRADGYHTLDTLMQKVNLCDELELRLCEQGVHFSCPGSPVLENCDNLVYRAAELFLQTVGRQRSGLPCGVEISLKKNIPVAAGLGGGSSDAAATLKGLDALLGCGCSGEELAAMGLRLGADVPFFLADTSAAIAKGIGEILTPVAPLSGYDILLVNPGFPLSTQWVYQTFALTKNENASNIKNFQREIEAVAVQNGLAAGEKHFKPLRNDLEAVSASRYPEIGQLKNLMTANGAVATLMSGSGPTVFGLFVNRRSAETCHALFKRRFDHVYIVSSFSGKE